MVREALRSALKNWRPVRPLLVDQVRTLEVPVVTEVRRLLMRGDYDGAVLYAYPRALEDLERAYGVAFDPDWTHAEILVRGMQPEMGNLPEMFVRLHRLYEPVRYGRGGRRSAQDLQGLMMSIYSQRPMWRLYTELLMRVPEGAAEVDPVPPAARAEGT
ncbi:MAG: hypothetical protein L3K19_06765 [Thermoplasmata archaeon]|nr:hypothetical protein [Thermoplasmata archaeon]